MNVVDAVAVTHRGRVRPGNEDTVAVAGFLSAAEQGEPVRVSVSSTRPFTGLVADGMGGHAEGGRASRLAARVITDASPAFRDADAIVAAVCAANTAVHAEAKTVDGWAGMGTTVVVLAVADGAATCVNVGDSRCYLMRDENLVQVSTDDAPPPVGAVPVMKTGVVTQTLGGTADERPVRPHVHRVEVRAGDRFLLCSDGLTDVVPVDDIEAALNDPADAVDAVRDLLRRALDAGGPDNISALLVTIPEQPTDPVPPE
jgi:serine/threonine protein phosphatase PrpC